jgi:hypothetical protein
MLDFTAIVDSIADSATFPSKVLEVAGHTFSLTLCTTADDRKITKSMELVSFSNTLEEQENAFDYVKRLTIALCLKAIDGQEIPSNLVFESEPISGVDYLIEKMEEWPQALTDVIYSGCQDLRKQYANSLRDGLKFEWFDKPLYEVLEEESDPATRARVLREAKGIDPEAGMESEAATESPEAPRGSKSEFRPKVKRSQ